MKHIYSIFMLLIFSAVCSFESAAQAPLKMSYQSVIRDDANALVANRNVRIRISILHESIVGPVVYAETHSTVTNPNGLATLEIGSGIVNTGSLAAIDWEDGPYYIKTETDPTGGTNFSISGSSQLLS